MMAKKADILKALKEWGIDEDLYRDLDWNALQDYYSSVKEQREQEAAEAENAEVGGQSAGDDQIAPDDSEAEVEDLGDDDALDDPVAEDELEGDDEYELEDDGPELIDLVARTDCTFDALDDVEYQGRRYAAGSSVRIKPGKALSAGDKTAAYLRQHRVVKDG